MAFLAWLESLGVSTWVREGESIWSFPTVLTLHTLGLGLLVGASTVVNLRLLGMGRGYPLAPMRSMFTVMWLGFWMNLVTGILLFMATATSRVTDTLFLAKMVFVVLGVVIVFRIQRRVFGAPDPAAVESGRMLAVLSLVAWTAAITAGRLLAYI